MIATGWDQQFIQKLAAEMTAKGLMTGGSGAFVTWTFANQAARYAQSVTSGDLKKVAYQSDTKEFFALIDDTNVGNVRGWQPISPGPNFRTELTIGAGAALQHLSIPIVNDGFSDIEIRATGVDQTSGKCIGAEARIRVRSTSGTVDQPFGPWEAEVVPESGSGLDSTWLALSVISPNVDVALKSDAAHVVKVRLEATIRYMPFAA